MKRISSFSLLLLLSILIFVYHFGIGIYYVLGLEHPASLEFLYTGAFICGVVWWLQADTQKSSLSGQKPALRLTVSTVYKLSMKGRMKRFRILELS